MSKIQTHKVAWQAKLSGSFGYMISLVDPKVKTREVEDNHNSWKRRVFDLDSGLKLIVQNGIIELNAEQPHTLEKMMVLAKRFATILARQNPYTQLSLELCSLLDFSCATKSENDELESYYYTYPKTLEGCVPNFISWETTEHSRVKIIWRLGKIVDVDKNGDRIPIHRVVREHMFIGSSQKIVSLLVDNLDFYREDKLKIQNFICLTN